MGSVTVPYEAVGGARMANTYSTTGISGGGMTSIGVTVSWTSEGITGQGWGTLEGSINSNTTDDDIRTLINNYAYEFGGKYFVDTFGGFGCAYRG